MSPLDTEQAEYRGEALAARAVVGGGLMGLANLVPGISGGTMLLAAGVYSQFIRGVAEVSTLKLRRGTILLLGCIVGAAGAAFAGFAGPVSELVANHRWVMYSLFIGLTLGGVPILWRMMKPLRATEIVAALAGIVVMTLMAFAGDGSGAADGDERAFLMLFLAGAAAAAAMVLPGVSGSYLLLILGQYFTILGAVSGFKDGVLSFDRAAIVEPLPTLVPFGIGVIVGVVGISNVVKVLLEKCRRATLGVLLGLLLGAVIGLWPFQAGVAPEPGAELRGQAVVLTEDGLEFGGTGRPIEPKHFPTVFFAPSVLQVAGSIALVGVGLAVSLAVARLGRGAESS